MPSKSPAQKKADKQAWDKKNRVHLYAYYAAYRIKMRDEMQEAYGRKCRRCGETDPVVLVLDHVQDDGCKQKRWGRRLGGFKLYQVLKKSCWPQEGYQLLCCNCNHRKEYERRLCQV